MYFLLGIISGSLGYHIPTLIRWFRAEMRASYPTRTDPPHPGCHCMNCLNRRRS
jgi:hypothetical protein